jgi:hypothetical protein
MANVVAHKHSLYKRYVSEAPQGAQGVVWRKSLRKPKFPK